MERNRLLWILTSIQRRRIMVQSKLLELAKLPGVSDLPLRVKSHFIKALLAEMEGDAATAEYELNRAVEAEDTLSAAVPVGNR
jgi:hypothetical protein